MKSFVMIRTARRAVLAAVLAVFTGAMTLTMPLPARAEAANDIVDTAVAAGSFNTLVAAVQAAGLVDALKGPGPLTVFAPTDEAFAKLPEGTLDSLLKPENAEQLKAILLYHVVSGKVMSSDIKGEVKPETLQGATLDVKASSGGVMVNNAKVVGADVVTSNGVIHVIDTVVLPPAS